MLRATWLTRACRNAAGRQRRPRLGGDLLALGRANLDGRIAWITRIAALALIAWAPAGLYSALA